MRPRTPLAFCFLVAVLPTGALWARAANHQRQTRRETNHQRALQRHDDGPSASAASVVAMLGIDDGRTQISATGGPDAGQAGAKDGADEFLSGPRKLLGDIAEMGSNFNMSRAREIGVEVGAKEKDVERPGGAQRRKQMRDEKRPAEVKSAEADVEADQRSVRKAT